MTDEEKAKIFIRKHFGTYTDNTMEYFVPKIVKLIRDEREACAKILDAKVRIHDAEGNLTFRWLFQHVADEIRTRSDK